MAACSGSPLLVAFVAYGFICSRIDQYVPGSSFMPPGESAITATVDRVIDGDSLEAHVRNQRTAIGYLGAETPAKNEPCGPEALERNRTLVGNRVLLQEDPAHEFDSIGRRLFYVYTPDGVSIDETLIREGVARAVRIDAAHGAALVTVEAEAQAARRGCLWSGP